MNNEYLDIYNNFIKLTRNKKLYLNLKNNDTFSDRLIILLFHFGFFLKIYKSQMSKKDAQNLFDFVVRQIELSIREIGYGDVSVNKKMKDYINLFYLILDKIEKLSLVDKAKKIEVFSEFFNIIEDNELFIDYFEKYVDFLTKSSLKNFTKDIIEFKF